MPEILALNKTNYPRCCFGGVKHNHMLVPSGGGSAASTSRTRLLGSQNILSRRIIPQFDRDIRMIRGDTRLTQIQQNGLVRMIRTFQRALEQDYERGDENLDNVEIMRRVDLLYELIEDVAPELFAYPEAEAFKTQTGKRDDEDDDDNENLPTAQSASDMHTGTLVSGSGKSKRQQRQRKY